MSSQFSMQNQANKLYTSSLINAGHLPFLEKTFLFTFLRMHLKSVLFLQSYFFFLIFSKLFKELGVSSRHSDYLATFLNDCDQICLDFTSFSRLFFFFFVQEDVSYFSYSLSSLFIFIQLPLIKIKAACLQLSFPVFLQNIWLEQGQRMGVIFILFKTHFRKTSHHFMMKPLQGSRPTASRILPHTLN